MHQETRRSPHEVYSLRARNPRPKARKKGKALRYFLGRHIVKVMFSLPRFIPLSCARSLSTFIVAAGALYRGTYRRLALAHLAEYYGDEKTPSELKTMLKSIAAEITKNAIEAVYAVSDRKHELYGPMPITGREYLDQALRQGKGVIALSAHIGNFAVMGGKLLSEGYPFRLVLKLPKDPWMARYFAGKMEEHGLVFISAGGEAFPHKEILRALRNNEIVGLISDGDQRVGGVPVRFMGRDLAMPPGAAVLAQRSGAAILPMFIIRRPDDSHQVFIEPPLEARKDESSQDMVLSFCQEAARIMESYIRRYPAQWYWVNTTHRHGRYHRHVPKSPVA